MLKNKFLKRSALVCLTALTGIQLANQVQNVSAATISFPNRGLMRIDGTQAALNAGPMTMDGRVVYCVEPNNAVESGTQYAAGVEIAGQVVSFNKQPLNQLQRYAVIPYLIRNFSDDDIRKLYGNDTTTADQMISARRHVSYLEIQRLIWAVEGTDHLGSVTPEDVRGVNGQIVISKATPEEVSAHMARMAYARIVKGLVDKGLEAFDQGRLRYRGGSVYFDGVQDTITEEGADVIWAEAFIKVSKSMIQINGVDKPQWDLNGVRVGVYRDAAGNDQHAVMTIGAGNTSNVVKIDPDTNYYLYELDSAGQPIMRSEQKVIDGRHFTGGKFEGQQGFGMTINIPAGQHSEAADAKVIGLENVPEIVNARFKKSSASLISHETTKQYSIEGAEYTLYRTRQDAQSGSNPLQTVRVDADGVGQFENLVRDVYYAKETKVPTIMTTVGEKETHQLSNVIHELDLTSGGTQDIQTSTDATGANYPVREFVFEQSFKDVEKVVVDEPVDAIYKIDKELQQSIAQGFATLRDGEFKIEFWSPETLGGLSNKYFEATYKTDENGQINIFDKSTVVAGSVDNQDVFDNVYRQYETKQNWLLADLVVTEVNAPNGYHINPDPVRIPAVLKPGRQLRQQDINAKLADDDFELTLVKRQKVENEWQEDTAKFIPGVKFQLTNVTTGQATGQNGVQELVVGPDGKASFKGLSAGDYELREIEVPAGYQINKQVIRFTVGKNAKILNKSTSIETDDDGNYRIDWAENRVSEHTGVNEDLDILVDNIPTRATAKVVKVNEKGEALAGATFTLTRLDDNGRPRDDEQPISVTTDEQGFADFDGLVIGDYYTIEETKAPVGYKLPRERQVIKFRAESIPVDDSFAVTYEFDVLDQYDLSNRTSVKKAGKLTTHTNSMSHQTKENTTNGMSFTVDGNEQMHIQFSQVNHTWQKLPATGSKTAMVAGSVAMTLVFSGGVAMIAKSKRKSV